MGVKGFPKLRSEAVWVRLLQGKENLGLHSPETMHARAVQLEDEEHFGGNAYDIGGHIALEFSLLSQC